MNPPLFSSRTPGQQVVIANVVPALFGLIVGVTAGVSKPLYLLLSLVGLAGAYFAGLEHKYPEEGLLRGAAAGLLFGVFILLGRAITGLDDKVEIPPGIVLIFLTTVISALGGAFGASRRRKREGGREHAPRTAPVGGA
jgi:drug/metabolite transporter (DMT)-like permease